MSFPRKKGSPVDRASLPRVNENLVAIGGDLSIPSLLAAYKAGCFPWTYSPISWWSPDPRTIMEFEEFHVSRSLRRSIRKYTVTCDLCFREVMQGCTETKPGRETTWIAPQFIEAYSKMHDAGYAHSLECWQEDKLVGGLYGLALGGYFVGESMFSRATDASKVVLAHLVPYLKSRGFVLFDIQMPTPVTMQLGGTLIPRTEFLKRLQAALAVPATFGPAGKIEYLG